VGEVVTDASASIIAMMGNLPLCLHVACYGLLIFSYRPQISRYSTFTGRLAQSQEAT